MTKSAAKLESDAAATQAPVRLVHVAAWVRSIGGVETLLARHAEYDAAGGLAATQVALFDRPHHGGERSSAYVPMRFTWRSSPRGMRRALDHELAAQAGAVTVWHNGWGLPWFADADHSARRIVCLWDGPRHFAPWLVQVRHLVDGVICMSDSAAEEVARLLPDWPAERSQVLKVPLQPPAGLSAERPDREEWVIGCAGRLVKPQKRWERLVPFVQELRRLGVSYRIEVVSDGPLRPWLQQQLGDDARVQFLGWQSREDYWQRLQNWDASVSFTDHEGGPIVLLETMAAGALPIFPAIGGSLGDDYLPRLDQRCQYAAGDPIAAARAVRDLQQRPKTERAALRRQAQTFAGLHEPKLYDADFAQFVRRVSLLPRISTQASHQRRGSWWEHLPLGAVTRALPAKLWC